MTDSEKKILRTRDQDLSTRPYPARSAEEINSEQKKMLVQLKFNSKRLEYFDVKYLSHNIKNPRLSIVIAVGSHTEVDFLRRWIGLYQGD